jgi:hypothetical protein
LQSGLQRAKNFCSLLTYGISFGIDMRARIVKIQEYTNKGTLLKYEDFTIKP